VVTVTTAGPDTGRRRSQGRGASRCPALPDRLAYPRVRAGARRPSVPAARIHRNGPLRRSGVSGPGRAGADRPRDSGLRGTYRVPRGPTGGSRSRRGGSRSAAGATDFNSVHVKNYVSCHQGLTNTVETLHLKAYGDIRSALASGSRDRRQGRSAPDPLIHDRPLQSGSKVTATGSEDEPRPLWRPAVPYRRPTHCSRLR
jgi:hypothetical protein